MESSYGIDAPPAKRFHGNDPNDHKSQIQDNSYDSYHKQNTNKEDKHINHFNDENLNNNSCSGDRAPTSNNERQMNSHSERNNPSSKSGDCHHNMSYSVLISANLVGYLIGRSGTSIREIEKASGASIWMQKNIEHRIITSDDRMMTLSGSEKEKVRALELILKKLQQGRTGNAINQKFDSKETVVIVVPKRSISLIIGTKGVKISEISKKSGCEIQVHKEQTSVPEERAISIRATSISDVVEGVRLIYSAMKEAIEMRKLTTADFLSIGISGGRGNRSSMTPGFMRPPPPYDQSLNSYNRSTSSNRPESSNYTQGPGLSNSPGNLLLHPLGNYMSNSILKLLVLKESAGWIIGPGGSRVREICNEVTTEINISSESQSESLGISPCERSLAIKGSINAKFVLVSRLILPMQLQLESKSKDPHARTLRLIVPNSSVSHIIGTKGSVVHNITRLSGAEIQIENEIVCNNERIVVLNGTVEARTIAMCLIMQKLEELENPDIVNEGLSIPMSEILSKISACTGRPIPHAEQISNTSMGSDFWPIPHHPPPPHQNLSTTAQNYGYNHSHDSKSNQSINSRWNSDTINPTSIPNETAERHFLRAASQVTTPRVIATSQQYSLELFFPKALVDFLTSIDEDGRSAIEKISERSGCNVQLAAEWPGAQSRGVNLTGTPCQNSLAVLMLHERFIDYDSSSIPQNYNMGVGQRK